jgi:hypothetical protein
MMHWPLPAKVTVEPDTLQTPALLGSVVKTTPSPDVDVAVMV